MKQTRLALAALPWHPFDYLSLQLGTLTAYLRRAGYQVDALHYYRDFGTYLPYRVFSALHQGSQGEALFAALLFPERREAIARQVNPALPPGEDFNAVLAAAGRYLDDLAAHRDWRQYAAVGFTLSHEQLMASMGLARRIKALSPQTLVFVGGALVLPSEAPGLLRAFPEIDFAVCGEGEDTLTDVAERLSAGDDDWAAVPGLAYRREGEVRLSPPRPLIEDLDSLPYPDFTDFFREEVREGSSRVVPRVCFEIARGCSWGKCRFCNLSRQWGARVRSKSPQRVAEEVAHLVKTYRSSRLLVCDTNVSAWREAFEAITALGLDLEIFAEVSAHLDRDVFELLRRAGVRSIQVGIESFSQHLLDRFRKGVSVMRNLEILKWSAELGIQIGYNIIIRYPDERPDDVAETLETMRLARHFAPPSLVNYSLSFGSEAFLYPEKHNVKGHSIPEYYREVYPPEVLAEVPSLLTLWVIPEPLRDSAADWSPVERAADEWRAAWRRNPEPKRLVWRDCGDFLIVDALPEPGETARSWRLSDLHRRVYLACDRQARNVVELAQSLGAGETETRAVAEDLHRLGILFCHGDSALALAVHDA